MKRLLAILLFISHTTQHAANVFSNQAEGKYNGIKAFIGSISAPNFSSLRNPIDEYAKEHNKEALPVGFFLEEKVKEYSGIKEATRDSASPKVREQIKNLEKELAEKSKELAGQIATIQKSTFTRKEKRFALDLYKHALDKVQQEAEKLRKIVFNKPISAIDMADIKEQVQRFSGKTFGEFQKKLRSAPHTWDKMVELVMLEGDSPTSLAHKAGLLKIKEAVLSTDKEALAEYRKKAVAIQKNNTIYSAIMQGIAPVLLI
jgi:DNA gyrase/topoisomerase IV subunit B